MLKFSRKEDNTFESSKKMALPNGQQVMAKKGDIILAHQKLAHCGGPNGSDRIRYCVYFRVTHRLHQELKDAALEDLWLEYEGL